MAMVRSPTRDSRWVPLSSQMFGGGTPVAGVPCCERSPQSDAAVPPAVSESCVSAEGTQAGPAEHSGPGVE